MSNYPLKRPASHPPPASRLPAGPPVVRILPP
jgi:hypothetical protein